MTASKDRDPYANPRAFYGSELARLRDAAGLSQEQLGARAFCSGSYIGQFESAIRVPQLELSKRFDEIFGTGEHMQRLCRLARQAKCVADYAVDAVDLEPKAKSITAYSPVLVPGLLQTANYTHAITCAAQPFVAKATVDRWMGGRMERQKILRDPSHPVLSTVVCESALRAHIGGPAVMRQQTGHLIEMAQRSRVVVQVLPFTAMAEAFMDSFVTLMDFCDSPPVLYTEWARSGRLIEERDVVDHNRRLFDLVRAAALSRAASLDFLRTVHDEFAAK
ncbi:MULTISPECIES: helix-turn-helix domain-containing protein [Streptomyces]|uniref:helix-turn-helix domain-containing protein n=1 Tax=Streptomyces TaxID=1883 RepID=UPI00163CB4BD|nr:MULTISPECIES: helix-turn-helix transcriptional regulator [Streptomyces]MBC2876673.1 helix-turn-helix transcriptional regulator [Streptomyces sp. TYQ1024]UBI36303.1 helix-turn-helix transcriptional regulator [Streptomyces mobaraensis]UKW28897.1 helix-turn-helix transcriptional regulator [Streptomyces sp. TYQ1024]